MLHHAKRSRNTGWTRDTVKEEMKVDLHDENTREKRSKGWVAEMKVDDTDCTAPFIHSVP